MDPLADIPEPEPEATEEIPPEIPESVVVMDRRKRARVALALPKSIGTTRSRAQNQPTELEASDNDLATPGPSFSGSGSSVEEVEVDGPVYEDGLVWENEPPPLTGKNQGRGILKSKRTCPTSPEEGTGEPTASDSETPRKVRYCVE